MTRLPEDMVREFHERFGFYVEDNPTIPPEKIRAERARLIGSEAGEVIAELLAGHPDGLNVQREIMDDFTDRSYPPDRRPMLDRIAAEHGDLAYVNSGGAVNAGVPLTAVVAEIHAANMRKLGPDGQPIINEHGKAMKPPGWQPPDIAAVLAGTTTLPGIRPVTYWEAWCAGDGSGEHQIASGYNDSTAYGEPDSWHSELDDNDTGCILPDGRVFCAEHVPPEVCLSYGTTTYVHEPADDDPTECVNCGAEMPAATPQAVTA